MKFLHAETADNISPRRLFMRWKCWIVVLAMGLGWMAGAGARAAVHELDVPLENGKLRCDDLTAAFLKKLHLPGVGYGSLSLDLKEYERSDFICALNKSLGAGGH